jgi:4-hydroxy-2-oxoheptanedioate aldolase
MAIRDILRNSVEEKLARDEVAASMTVRLVRTIEIARIARTAGFDTLYVDLEHSSFSLETCGQICIAALEAGITPFVRVPANTPDYISRVLDGGALGVIVPHIRSAQDARAVVKAAKFPPLGERSNAGGLPHRHFRSFPAAEMHAALNDATMVVVQFESAAALAQADEIIAVDGVDTVLIGLNDLLGDLGFPANTTILACVKSMPRPSPPAASAASTAVSEGLRRVPISPPSSSKWARVTYRRAPTSRFSPRPARRAHGRSRPSRSDRSRGGRPCLARGRA